MIEASSEHEQGEEPDEEKERTAMPLVAVLTLLLGGLLVWSVMANRPRTPPPEPVAAPPQIPAPAAGPAVDTLPPEPAQDRTARTELDERLTRLEERAQNGGQTLDLQQEFRNLADDAWRQGEKDIAERVREQLDGLRRQRSTAARTVLDELETNVQPLAERGDYLEAAELLRAYQGPGEVATARSRLARARALEAKARERTESEWVIFRDRVLTEILANASVESAMALVIRARQESSLEPLRAQVAAFEQELVQASRAPSDVMASFADDLGQEVVVMLARGPKRLVITGTGQDSVSGTQELAQGSLTYTFRYRDLAWQEKVGRLARDGTPASQFMLGLLALEAGEEQHAVSSFRRAGGELSRALADRLSETGSDPDAANPLE
jgi:hypothetical protein